MGGKSSTERIPKERRVHCQPSKGIVIKNKMAPIYFWKIVGMEDVLISSIGIISWELYVGIQRSLELRISHPLEVLASYRFISRSVTLALLMASAQDCRDAQCETARGMVALRLKSQFPRD